MKVGVQHSRKKHINNIEELNLMKHIVIIVWIYLTISLRLNPTQSKFGISDYFTPSNYEITLN